MKASLKSVRIAPKKAQIVAKMIRGKSVQDAMIILERTNKKAARLLEDLLKSAMANASHNENQDPQTMVITSLVVNQAQAYHRGVPMARGRVRSMCKFLSHITLTLGIPEVKEEKEVKEVKEKRETKASPAAKKSVKSTSNTTKSTGSKPKKKGTAASASKSSTSKKSSSKS